MCKICLAIDMPYMNYFLYAHTSISIWNTQSVQDDQQTQIVHVAICLVVFWNSYDYLIHYQREDSRAY